MHSLQLKKYISSIYHPWSLVVLEYATKNLLKVKITDFLILRTGRKKGIHVILKKLLI